MILGECPYDDCDQFEGREIPNGVRLPAFAQDTCSGCGRIVWVRFSRVDPVAYTEADFLARYVVDEETQQILDPPAAGSSDG